MADDRDCPGLLSGDRGHRMVVGHVAGRRLTLLAWFGWEWANFVYRIRRSAGNWTVERTVIQSERHVTTLWVGTPTLMELSITLKANHEFPFVMIEDRLPEQFHDSGQRAEESFHIHPNTPIVLRYGFTPEEPGILRFEGVHLRIADRGGLFYQRLFLRFPTELLVLPPLYVKEGHQGADKRINSLPPPGVHRLRRPGSGTELLDLREYRPGDPPKMIAWKSSARRDVLITKEYESDIPVRLMIFLDASESVRSADPKTAILPRLATIASAIVQASALNRDLVGLTTFDEENYEAIQPDRKQTHTLQLMHTIGKIAARMPSPKSYDVETLTRHAYPIAQELYPDLLTRDVNSRPIGLFWLPLSDSRAFWLVPAAMLLSGFILSRAAWWNFVAWVVLELKPDTGSVIFNIVVTLMLMSTIAFLPISLMLVFWLFYGIRGFLGKRPARQSKRKQLSAIYACLDQSDPHWVETYLNNDQELVKRTRSFLTDHRVTVPAEVHELEPIEAINDNRKNDTLSTCIQRTLQRARDNELYVILADFKDASASLESVCRAIKAVRVRYHQVVVVLPWPLGVGTEPSELLSTTSEPETRVLKLGSMIDVVLTHRLQKAYEGIRKELTRAGATVIRIQHDDPVAVVAQRMDQIRLGRIKA